MRITKVNIPKDLIDNGLESIKMDKLGQVVLLAGKNGSGKSRILDLIYNKIQNKTTIEEVNLLDEQRKNLLNQRSRNESNIFPTRVGQTNPYIKKRNDLNNQIDKKEKEINNLLDNQIIETDYLYDSYTIVNFVPKEKNLSDPNKFNKNDIKNFSKKVETLGIDNFNYSTLSKIQHLQDQYFSVTHQDLNSSIEQKEKDELVNEYNNLKDLLKNILDVELSRNSDGEATLFGFPIGNAKLSDGQKILIQFCIAIHSQQKSLDEIILFLDEPENHLHPSIVIEIIEKIKSKIPNGQIWIATHSIPILSHFDSSCLWFVDNNKVSYAGTIPEKVLSSLLGDDDEIGKLQDFISLPSIFALNKYAFESLFHPESVMTGKDDPQVLQIRDEIKKNLKDSNKIRILDYGAGKGRLLSNIIENNTQEISEFIKWFDYFAYDLFDNDKEECVSVLDKIYDNPQKRYFNKFNDLFSHLDENSFDIVIMCNVLHEIDPKDWLTIFSKEGDLYRLLSDKGILLIVEDQKMMVGEKAYKNGFIVLDTSELRSLFNITEEDKEFGINDFRKDGKLKSHRISRDYFTRISSDSRIKALKSIQTKAKSEIINIRKQEPSFKNGKLHGFWVQQLANTTLALSEFFSDNS